MIPNGTKWKSTDNYFLVLMGDMGHGNDVKRRIRNEKAVFGTITAGIDVFITSADDGRGKYKHRCFATATHRICRTAEVGGGA
jgi:hypothetical protein